MGRCEELLLTVFYSSYSYHSKQLHVILLCSGVVVEQPGNEFVPVPTYVINTQYLSLI